MSHTIELRKVSKYYAGEDSVSMGFSRIDLGLDIGEFVVITGESGSGKSTLLNVISGLDTYEEGEMFVCGQDTTAYGPEDYETYRKTYIGNIFQDFNLINSYTVYQNIELVMLLSGKKRSECKERVLELIDLVGLSEYRRTKASRLSGGQKQRVAIARALAKDAPIIVADEPTGNLDSASAENVMETLARVSKDKLVVIVTHNYEQAEPYVTRKITMHDGKIIEDKQIAPPRTDPEVDYLTESDIVSPDDAALSDDPYSADGGAAPKRISRVERAGNRVIRSEAGKVKGMRRSSEILLGVRNTFNIPAKFILLFIVYFFVSTAVLGQYATTKNSMHESALLGTNPYFINSSSDRVVIKKKDESRFTDEDFSRIENTENIREIVKNDYALDSGVSFKLGDYIVEGPVMPQSSIKKSDLTYGHMPSNDYEIVIKVDMSNDIMLGMISGSGDEYIGKVVELQDIGQIQRYSFAEPVKIAGIIVNNDESRNEFDVYGYSTVYCSEAMSNQLMVTMMAASSKSEMYFDKTKVENSTGRSVYYNSGIPEGKVYIFDDETYYYPEEKAEGKDFSLKIMNRFFESEGSYKVDKVITEKNCKELLGLTKEEYDMFYNCVFLSETDFNKLFDKGYYQISAFLENEQKSADTLKELRSKGFTCLALKDALSDATGGNDVIVKGMTYGRLALEFIILFFIAYAVIKLIMKSRNSYYSTLRILGATKKNTANILRVELILMMIIAYGVDIILVILISNKVLDIKELNKLLFYLTPADYIALGVLLLLMSLLLANRYARSIFKRSAMKAFREGAN